jgi:hypothetical protein
MDMLDVPGLSKEAATQTACGKLKVLGDCGSYQPERALGPASYVLSKFAAYLLLVNG